MAGASIVRIPVESTDRPRRTLDERFFLRAPGALQAIYRLLSTRGPDSKLRRAVLVQSQLAGWEAQNREDWDVNLMAFHPDYVFTFEGDDLRMGPDIDASHVGRDGVVGMMETWRAGFEELRFEPREVLDPGGDRFGARVEQFGRSSAGVVASQEIWCVYWTRDGLIHRQTIYYDEADALAALTA